MSFDLTNSELISRSEKLAKMQMVSDEFYADVIPEEMSAKRLHNIFFTVFGVDFIEVFLDKNVFETKSILVTEFSSAGFFWAQSEDSATSQEYQDLYEKINRYAQSSDELASLESKWCIASFQGEWFRAYIEEVIGKTQLKVFFVDYGTTSVVKHSDTRAVEDEDVWVVAPLAIPCVLKDITISKFNKFKKLQYTVLQVKSIKLIESNYVCEVELLDEKGRSLLAVL